MNRLAAPYTHATGPVCGAGSLECPHTNKIEKFSMHISIVNKLQSAPIPIDQEMYIYIRRPMG
jgi:hypothetical protein